MRIAVTGASGFIGRHVLARLDARSVETIAVVRDPARLADRPHRVRVVEMDVASPPADCFLRLGRPDVLIHLAWNGLPNYMSRHHVETELPRQYRFLEALVRQGLPALVVAGTCSEYGMQAGELAESLATFPVNVYGHAKDALRRQLEMLRAVRFFGFTWARLFYTYGEGQANGSIYSQLKHAVERRERVFNMSGGEQLRDYLPVATVAELLVELAIRRRDAGVVNVCAGKPISVRKLVQGWLEENGWDIELNLGHYPYPEYEPMAFWGNRRYLDSLVGGA